MVSIYPVLYFIVFFSETIVGVNKYQPEKEETVDVLTIDNTKVRESQVNYIYIYIYILPCYMTVVTIFCTNTLSGFVDLLKVAKLKEIKEKRNNQEVSIVILNCSAGNTSVLSCSCTGEYECIIM